MTNKEYLEVAIEEVAVALATATSDEERNNLKNIMCIIKRQLETA